MNPGAPPSILAPPLTALGTSPSNLHRKSRGDSHMTEKRLARENARGLNNAILIIRSQPETCNKQEVDIQNWEAS